jgi:hypothetical protein
LRERIGVRVRQLGDRHYGLIIAKAATLRRARTLSGRAGRDSLSRLRERVGVRVRRLVARIERWRNPGAAVRLVPDFVSRNPGYDDKP